MCFQCRYAPLQRCLCTDTVGVLRCLENRESENASIPSKKILPSRRHLLPFHFRTDSVVAGGKAPALTPCFKEYVTISKENSWLQPFCHSIKDQTLLPLHGDIVSAACAAGYRPSSFHIYSESLLVAERLLNE